MAARRRKRKAVSPDRVLEVLREGGRWHVGDVAVRLRETPNRVWRALRRLRGEGLVEMVGVRGGATWTAVGASPAAQEACDA